MGFNFYDSYYGYYIGIQIRGTIGKTFVYQVIHGEQFKRRYVIPYDPKTPAQQRLRDLFKKAIQSWKKFSDQEKSDLEKLKPAYLIMSGFNYYISSYMKTYI